MLDFERTILENMMSSKDDLREPEARNVLGSFLFVGDDVHKPVKVLSGGERTRLALATLVVSAANVLLLDEPTNNLDPASREEILGALGEYQGAVIMVSHDEGAVQALKPERVILLPDGDEDIWKDEYFDLVAIDQLIFQKIINSDCINHNQLDFLKPVGHFGVVPVIFFSLIPFLHVIVYF